MSLIGSLEDLGLGDILQIIHLSQKSGVLSIRGDGGEGQIVFQNGLVRLATMKGDPEDLRGLLVPGCFVSEADFEVAANFAKESGVELLAALEQQTSISLERIDSLRRECAEKAVGRMFSWVSGEFSFDVGAESDWLNNEMALSTGVNAQFMAMESLRIWDESHRPGGSESDDQSVADTGTDLNLDLSAEEMFGVTETAAASEDDGVVEEVEVIEELEPVDVDTVELVEDSSVGPEGISEIIAEDTSQGPVDLLVEATAERVAPEMETGQTLKDEVLPPVIVIDESLSVLNWARQALAKHFASVHVFQRSQEGLGRIRQYLARAQAPILLISPEIDGNPLSGIVDAADYVNRLRGQAPHMPIAWLVAEDKADGCALPVALPIAVHPSESAMQTADSPDQQILAQQLTATLREESARLLSKGRASGASSAVKVEARREMAPANDLERLKIATQALSDASSRGEVLPLVIRFAAESFERVAMFMVRGEQIIGMAQHGLEATGGPDDVEMRALQFERSEVGRFSEVIESLNPIQVPVRDAGDQRLCELLGSEPGRNAYIAPIVSGEQVVALLYAENGPSEEDPGDTSALEVVLHHAGIALDRAVLERTLAEADEQR
ncbi:MAG: DUF4388 domain-containing protein [Myxococcales bacterium]|nr:DUF4388 domain-containing protein [Myxococcales bacterium]